MFKGRLLPDKSTVENDVHKPISKVSREWIIYLNNSNMHKHKPSFTTQSKRDTFDSHEHEIIMMARGEPFEFYD
jgi:hypothetical protein